MRKKRKKITQTPQTIKMLLAFNLSSFWLNHKRNERQTKTAFKSKRKLYGIHGKGDSARNKLKTQACKRQLIKRVTRISIIYSNPTNFLIAIFALIPFQIKAPSRLSGLLSPGTTLRLAVIYWFTFSFAAPW